MGESGSSGNTNSPSEEGSRWLKVLLSLIGAVVAIAGAVSAVANYMHDGSPKVFVITGGAGSGSPIQSKPQDSGSPSAFSSPSPTPEESSSPNSSGQPTSDSETGWTYHYTISGLGSGPADIDDSSNDPDKSPDLSWTGTALKSANGAHIVGGLSGSGFSLQQCQQNDSAGQHFDAVDISGARLPVHVCVTTSAGNLRQVIVKAQDSQTGALTIDVEWPS